MAKRIKKPEVIVPKVVEPKKVDKRSKAYRFEMTEQTNHKLETFFKCIADGHSIVSACKMAQINRQTFYNWMSKSPANAKKYYDLIDSRSLIVEDALFKSATDGNTIAQIFFLKNRSNERWKDRTESTVNGNITMSFADFIKPSNNLRLNE